MPNPCDPDSPAPQRLQGIHHSDKADETRAAQGFLAIAHSISLAPTVNLEGKDY